MMSTVKTAKETQALLDQVNRLIGQDLKVVDRLFMDELGSQTDCVNQLVRHVSRFRGKMLRPCLVLLSGQALGVTAHPHHVVATVVEMVHMATLVHDDVLDEAELRRRGATINHLRGNEAAVLLGDYLISHSYHLCSSLDNQRAARAIAATTNHVCEGELLQLHNRRNWDLDEKTYYDIIGLKTASLCATCCELGAVFSTDDETAIAKFQQYGEAVGTAFQVQDDILDLVGQQSQVGKTLGSDIYKGKLTLPLIHFLKTAPDEHRVLLRNLLASPDEDRAERIRNLVRPSGSVEYAQRCATDLAKKAKQLLADVPASPAKHALEEVAEFSAARTY